MYLICLLVIFFISHNVAEKYDEEHYAVTYASRCEACKYTMDEFEGLMKETGKTHDVIETGYGFEKKKKVKYVKSQTRLDHIFDDVCERMNTYKIHKERIDSSRFAKHISQTFSALQGLVNKGVKVDIGMPHDLWDKPSAEIERLKKQCEDIVGDDANEERLFKWYFNENKEQDIPLKTYFCEQHYLKTESPACLFEVFDPVKSVEKKSDDKSDSEKKGDDGDDDKSKSKKKKKAKKTSTKDEKKDEKKTDDKKDKKKTDEL